MAEQVGSIVYDARINTDNLKNDASKVDDAAKSIGDRFQAAEKGSMALLAGVTAVGVGVAAFGVSSVKNFMDAEGALAQLNAVIKSTGGAAGMTSKALTDQASALQAVTKFSDEAVMGTQSMLLTFTNIGQKVFPQATETALDMAQALGMDGSQAAMQLGKALNDPAEGISKLQRVGVTFNAEQEKTIKGMVEAGDVAGAQAVMLQELQKEFGGSAKAAGMTFGGQLTILKNTFGDVMEVVGEFLVSYLQPFVDGLNIWVKALIATGDPIAAVGNKLKEWTPYIAIISGAILMGLVPAIAALTGGFVAMMAPLIPFIAAGAAIGFLVNQLAQAMGGWGNLLRALTPAWQALVSVMQIAMGVFSAIVGFFREHQSAMAALTGVLIAVMIPTVIALTTAFVAWGVAAVAAAAATIIAFLPLIVIGAAIGAIAYLIINNWSTLVSWWGKANDFIAQKMQQTGDWIRGVWESVRNGIASAINGVVSIAQSIPGRIAGAVGNLGSTLYNAGRDTIQGFINGVMSMGGALASGIKGLVERNVPGPVRKVLGIGSPSKLFAQYGKWTMQGFMGGVDSQSSALGATMNSAFSDLTPALTPSTVGADSINGISDVGGPSVVNHIGQITISSDVDGERWLKRLGRDDEITSLGVVPS